MADEDGGARKDGQVLIERVASGRALSTERVRERRDTDAIIVRLAFRKAICADFCALHTARHARRPEHLIKRIHRFAFTIGCTID